MIQSQNGTPGVIGQQHGLTRLTETLERLERGQHAQAQRETQLQTQLTSQASALSKVAQQVRWLRSILIGAAAILIMLAGLIGWQVSHPPDARYAHALGALDSTLLQQWPVLPKGTQEAVAHTYRQLGMIPPGQRK